MVAFAGPDPIAVLIGAKRPSGTLVHRIAVHPEHQRQGHGRHLLDSLGSKLAILGPPRIVAEVPERLASACELFSACGFAEEALLTDYVLTDAPADSRASGYLDAGLVRREAADALTADASPCLAAGFVRREAAGALPAGHIPQERNPGSAPVCTAGGIGSLSADLADTFVIPVTVDDLVANDLFDETDRHMCWSRSAETLAATKDDIAGLAVASDERIEAYLLYLEQAGASTEIMALRSFVEDGGTRLAHLLAQLRGRGMNTVQYAKVSSTEISSEWLETFGFTPAARHLRYAATARSQ